MPELSPPAAPPTLPAASPPAPPRRRGCLVPSLVGIIVVLLVLIGCWFWFNRPIKPVQLNAQEKATVQQKVEAIQNPEVEKVPTTPSNTPAEPKYEKGSRDIVLTERELNGLLNEQSLGDKWKIELATDAVHLRLETDLPADLPIVGGKHLKARSRFIIKTDAQGAHFILDDLTIWGVSLPNDWLGQLKGKDLLGEVLGGGKGGKVAGIEEMKVESGQLKIRLKE